MSSLAVAWKSTVFLELKDFVQRLIFSLFFGIGRLKRSQSGSLGSSLNTSTCLTDTAAICGVSFEVHGGGGVGF